jgi:hypothetical protein
MKEQYDEIVRRYGIAGARERFKTFYHWDDDTIDNIDRNYYEIFPNGGYSRKRKNKRRKPLRKSRRSF